MRYRVRSIMLAAIALTLIAAVGTGCPKRGGDVDTTPSAEATEADSTDDRADATPAPTRTEVRDTGFPAEEDPSREQIPPTRTAAEWNRDRVLQPIFFAFDSDELTAQAKGTLRNHAEWLKAHTELGVVVEGHCDERGTIEYNLALGQRRARSVRDYMTTLGVDRNRIRTVSYGEERPVDAGHSESAWSKNRRGEFTLEDR